MMSPDSSGLAIHELDRLAARADHGADEIAARRRGLAGRDADDVVERRQRFARR